MSDVSMKLLAFTFLMSGFVFVRNPDELSAEAELHLQYKMSW